MEREVLLRSLLKTSDPICQLYLSILGNLVLAGNYATLRVHGEYPQIASMDTARWMTGENRRRWCVERTSRRTSENLTKVTRCR